jgi:REP element-mobilizing transposase RayT
MARLGLSCYIGEIKFATERRLLNMRRCGQVAMVFKTHGGKRKGAGRPCKGARPSERHKARPVHNARHPVHVTIRVAPDVASLRTDDIYMQLRESTIVTAKREDFRIVHMSIQSNHLHLIVEADHKRALSKGIQGFSISAAKRINATITERTGVRRCGRVVADRYHARPLTSPRAVRHAVAYCLNNWRRHGEAKARSPKIDPFSSGSQFPDWKELEHSPFLFEDPEPYILIVYRPRTWLLAKGWQKHCPLISVHEVPGR